MKNKIVAGIAACVLAVGFVACSGEATQEQRSGFDKIKMGDTKAQVIKKAGKPDSTQKMQAAGITTVYYYYGLGDLQVVIENGKVTSINDY